MAPQDGSCYPTPWSIWSSKCLKTTSKSLYIWRADGSGLLERDLFFQGANGGVGLGVEEEKINS